MDRNKRVLFVCKMKRKLDRKLIDFTGKELPPSKIDYCLI